MPDLPSAQSAASRAAGAKSTGAKSTGAHRPGSQLPAEPEAAQVRPRNWLLAQWPIAIVLIGITVALLMIALDHFRRGSIVLSASVMLGAFLRLLLPDQEAGMLAVRSRKVDVAVLGGLAIGLSVFTYWVPPPN